MKNKVAKYVKVGLEEHQIKTMRPLYKKLLQRDTDALFAQVFDNAMQVVYLPPEVASAVCEVLKKYGCDHVDPV